MKRLLLAAGATLALVAGLSAQTVQAASAGPKAGAPPVINVQSCTGASFCLLTGFKPAHRFASFIELWNGKAWRLIPNPASYHGQITCGGPTFCLAVTDPPQKPGREIRWNGKAWKQFSPQPPVLGVVCMSPKFCATSNDNDEVDGTYWNGKVWQDMPEGNGAGCGGAFCTTEGFGCASATICWSDGQYCGDGDCDDGNFFWNDVWNGTAFDPGPDLSGPGSDDACTGQAFCLILDPPTATITDNLFQTSQDASVNLVTACRHLSSCALPTRPACGSPHFCLALPSQDPSGTLAWNGKKWGVAALALVGGHLPKLTDLVCGSPANCVATGTYQLSPRGAPQPVAEHWNGKAWKVTAIAKP
jgi:hypothetical protein